MFFCSHSIIFRSIVPTYTEMNNKWQKYISGGFIVLVLLLIGAKVVYNQQAKQLVWTDQNAEYLTAECVDDLASQGYAIRFPKQTEAYCDCSTKAIMAQLDKAEYLMLKSKGGEEESSRLLPVVLECFNKYQEEMFNASKLD